MSALSVRARLFLALALLAGAVLFVGAIAWGTLTRGTERLDRLHDETLQGVDRALSLSRQASDLSALAPYLLTLQSPFRIAQDGRAASDLLDRIEDGLPPDAPLRPRLQDSRAAIGILVGQSLERAALRDRILRRVAALGMAERRFAALAARPEDALSARLDWIMLQRAAASLLGAGQADNLISVGEYQREYTRLLLDGAVTGPEASEALAELRGLAEGSDGLFELRRHDLALRIGAEAALVRIRRGTAAVADYAQAVTEAAQAGIAAERTSTTTAIALARWTVLAVGLASALLALAVALFVSGYVTANLHRVSDAMMRLASGDRQSRLPRGTGQGDEIGKLFYAFRVFRANALRLDRSNRQIAKRNALFENVLTGIRDGVAILSDQGQLVTHNDRLAEVLRLDPASLAGRPHLLSLLPAAGWQIEAGPTGFAALEGPGAHAEWRESPLLGGGTVVLVSDATERRQIDDRLRQIQRIEALGKVSGEVAHDFGNILSTISGNLHLLETAPPGRQQALRQTIASAVDLGTSLIDRLLAFARRQHLAPETVDLPDLVEAMTDLIAFALRDEITLEVRVAQGPLPVLVDPGQLESAILNLCLNAAQAIEGPGTITISVERDGSRALLSVSDSGSGMTPDVLAHAMEPFFTTRTDGTGTGLGLAMVYGFIRQSGGDVTLTSAPDAGTIVQLSLPLQGAAPATPALPALGRVLLVEDDAGDRAAAHALLASIAREVICCATAAEARHRLASGGPALDLIVTDLMLGTRIEGWSIARDALGSAPLVRALIVSGSLPPTNPLEVDHPARSAMVAKPLEATALATALAALFSKGQDDDPLQGGDL